MHHAPALSLTLPPDRPWHCGIQGLSAATLVTTLLWLGWHALQVGTPTPLMLVVAAGSAVPVFWLRRWQAMVPVRELVWQPTNHHWRLQTRTGQLDCLADLGHWMLLRHRGPGLHTTWLPLSRRDHAAHWHALRCALFSPGPPIHPPLPSPADE